MRFLFNTLARILVLAVLCGGWEARSDAHDIYTGVVDKAGTLCCGINDCAVTKYKIRPEGIDFFWQDRKWIVVPERMITYAYLKGDDDGNGHLCARAALTGDNPERVFGDMFFYCGFLPPQGF